MDGLNTQSIFLSTKKEDNFDPNASRYSARPIRTGLETPQEAIATAKSSWNNRGNAYNILPALTQHSFYATTIKDEVGKMEQP
jgi:hypothetical protein